MCLIVYNYLHSGYTADMTTRHRVLALLEQHKGEFISGERIAEDLHMSRAAIWRAVRELRERGYDIEASTRVGYRLALASDKLSAEGIRSALDWPEPVAIHYFDSVDSTNKIAKQMALEGAPHGTVVVAGAQQGGRGRLGRSFFSPEGSGLYMSVVMRLDLPSSLALRITCAAAVSVCVAVESLGSDPASIKWVNDIYMRGKKVCGILTEGASGFESGRIESVIVGIGVNFSPPQGGFPSELSSIATAIFPDEVPSGVSRNRLCATIMRELLTSASRIDSPELMGLYRSRSAVIGKPVRVFQGGQSYDATVGGIADDGALLVRTADNAMHTLSSGEISIRPATGSF